MAKGPMLNLLRFKSREKIFWSSASKTTLTVDGSLKGFLKVNIDEVLFPTAVEIGWGSIIVGKSPLPATLYSHLPM